jgi:hypothetical protein
MIMQAVIATARGITLLAALIFLAACSSQEFVDPMPSDYEGPKARVYDTYSHNATNSAHFFVVNAVNGLPIEDSGHRTKSAMAGRSLTMRPQMVGRWVPAEEQTFTISGYVQFSSKAQAMVGEEMLVTGQVTFKPEPNGRYRVKGKLSEEESWVWVENSRGVLVGEKIQGTPADLE